MPVGGSGRNASRGKRAAGEPGRAGASSGIVAGRDTANMPEPSWRTVQQLSDQMLAAARDLQFELAARLRDEIADLKKELRGWTPPGSADDVGRAACTAATAGRRCTDRQRSYRAAALCGTAQGT